MIKPILTFVLLIMTGALWAQSANEVPVKQNSFTITTGYSQFKDENLLPKVNQGVTIGAMYQHSEISKIISEYGAGLKISLVNTRYEDFPSSAIIQLLGNYNYLFPVARIENLTYYLGPTADLQYGAHAYFNWDESHLYWANYLSAGIGNRVSYRLGDKTLNFTLDVPLISIISRPVNNRQFKIDDMTVAGILKNLSGNLEGALPDKNFFVKSGIELNYPASKNRSRAIGYNFKYHYMQASNGAPYQNIEHSIFYRFIF